MREADQISTLQGVLPIRCAPLGKVSRPGCAPRQDEGVLLLVITGPIASGKSKLARAVAQEFEAVGIQAAVVDLDLVYEMLDPGRAPKTNGTKWGQARRLAARLADALLAEGADVIVEGDFLTPAARREFERALASRVEPRFVTLRVSFDLAFERVQRDPTRGLSRDQAFLRDHYVETAAALRDAPVTDLAVDTGVVSISEAARAVAEWALPHDRVGRKSV